MIESFVDLTYRGLPLGRRIKLTQVRPSTGYLELPLPMPVGTQVAIATDEGIVLEAIVIDVHEQVGGSERLPGMTVKPELGDPASATASWWQARVALPELDARPLEVPHRPRSSGMVHPRSKTVSQQVTDTDRMPTIPEEPVPQVIDEHPVVDDGKATTIMSAVDQETLEKLSASASGEIEQVTRTTGEIPVVDDGKKTIVMETVDVSALELEHAAGPLVDDYQDDPENVTNGSSDPKRRKKRKTKQ